MSIRSLPIRSKLNQILKMWPRGTIAVSSWFKTQDISRQLLDSYKKSEWVNRIGRGAYSRTDDFVDWTGGLYAIQEQLKLPIHIGSKTALQISGIFHQIPLGKGQNVFLFGKTGVKLPKWFKEYKWDVKIHYTIYENDSKINLSGHEVNSRVLSG
ncbi:MAG: AbiEi antitoxin N-terminal domain-containing protein [Candidatus Aminicenantaceae bacterium]